MRKEASGTFGPPVESLRKDPAKFLKKGANTCTGTGAPVENGATGTATSGKAPSRAFTYPGERYSTSVLIRIAVIVYDRCPRFGLMLFARKNQ